MNTAERVLKSPKTPSKFSDLDKEEGFYNSSTIKKSPLKIFTFCQEASNLDKILADLPLGLERFFNLELVSAVENGLHDFEIKWQNKPDSAFQASLTFRLEPALLNRGTLVFAEAVFLNLPRKDEEPSTLVGIFLRRMKALLETGEIPTTKGQPSGREELNTLH